MPYVPYRARGHVGLGGASEPPVCVEGTHHRLHIQSEMAASYRYRPTLHLPYMNRQRDTDSIDRSAGLCVAPLARWIEWLPAHGIRPLLQHHSECVPAVFEHLGREIQMATQLGGTSAFIAC